MNQDAPLLTSLIPYDPPSPNTIVIEADSNVLTSNEHEDLDRLEGVIERGLRTFIEVGESLATIRDGRLYRHGHTTFEDYASARWGFGRRRADQLIAASAIGTNVLTAIPDALRKHGLSEAHVRALHGLEPAHAVEVYRAAADGHPGPLTANQIRATRRTLHPTQSKAADRPRKPYNAAKAESRELRTSVALMHRQLVEGIDRSSAPVSLPDSAEGDLQTVITGMRKVDLRALALGLAPTMAAQDKHDYAEQLAALANACLDARNVLLPDKYTSPQSNVSG